MIKNRTIESLLTIATGLLLIVLSIGLATEQPISAVISSLFLLPLIIAGVNQKLYRVNFPLTVIYNFGLLILNDVMIRTLLHSQGFEDNELLTRVFFGIMGVSMVPMLLHARLPGSRHASETRQRIGGRCVIAMVFGALTAAAHFYFLQ